MASPGASPTPTPNPSAYRRVPRRTRSAVWFSPLCCLRATRSVRVVIGAVRDRGAWPFTC
jgi:hypothetical protein